MRPDNAFKPKLHRYAANMAEGACRVASYALQFGLAGALDLGRSSAVATVKASRILLAVPVALAIALAILYAALSASGPAPITVSSCDPLPADIDYLGPPLTNAEIAAISNSQEWNQIKRKMGSGDNVHQFSWHAYFGYVVLRGECFIGKVTEGIA